MLRSQSKPIQILNIDTGEIYKSLQDAGRKLGYLTPLHLPEYGYEPGVEFVRKGVRLRIL